MTHAPARSRSSAAPVARWQPPQPAPRPHSSEPENEHRPVTATHGHDFGAVAIHAVSPLRLQPKLAINQPGDIYEQEADRVAEQVMRMPDPTKQPPQPVVSDKSSGARLQRKESGGVTSSQPSTLNSQPSYAPPIVHEVLRSPGQLLDAATRAFFEPRFSHESKSASTLLTDASLSPRSKANDLDRIRIHIDPKASASARMANAKAYTVGNHLVFDTAYYSPNTENGRYLIAHELAHSVQQQDANSCRLGGVPRPSLMRSPVEKTLKFTAKWLSKRTVDTVSKHIAKHGRAIADKAIHTVFKSPKKIKMMLKTAVAEATALAAKHPNGPTGHFIEEGGIRITRQATRTPGKVRWLVQKEFREAIGNKGERILRIVIDQSGRIVTAFPAERLAVLGLAAGGLSVLEERTASAAEQAHQENERAAKAADDRQSSLDWEDFIPYLGGIWGGSLNEGEDDMLRQDRFFRQMIDDICKEVEFEEQRSLGTDERDEIENFVRAGMAAPMVANDDDQEQG